MRYSCLHCRCLEVLGSGVQCSVVWWVTVEGCAVQWYLRTAGITVVVRTKLGQRRTKDNQTQRGFIWYPIISNISSPDDCVFFFSSCVLWRWITFDYSVTTSWGTSFPAGHTKRKFISHTLVCKTRNTPQNIKWIICLNFWFWLLSPRSRPWQRL